LWFFFFKILWIATVFSPMDFLFYFFIFQNYICQFYIFNIELIENLVLYFFFKTLFIATVFLHMVFFLFLFFFYDFLQNYLFWFYFLILSWLRITVTIYEESTAAFLANYCGLLQCFFHMVFPVLLCFFLKLSLSILFFKY
jgi:hypothetical protein